MARRGLAVLKSDSDAVWGLAAYNLDGTFVGWATSINSLVSNPSRAQRLTLEAASRRIPDMERAWRGYSRLWVEQKLPLEAVGLDTVKAGSVRLAAHPHTPARPVETCTPASPVESEAVVLKAKMKGVAKGKAAKPTDGKVKPAANGKDSTAKAMKRKPALRTTSSKASARVKSASSAASTNGGGPCLCACGAQVKKWLLRGHITRVRSSLAAIRRGDTTPEKVFGKKLAAAYGPWKAVGKLGGQVPATTNFDKVRAALQGA